MRKRIGRSFTFDGLNVAMLCKLVFTSVVPSLRFVQEYLCTAGVCAGVGAGVGVGVGTGAYK